MVDRVTAVEAPRGGKSSSMPTLAVLATTEEGTRWALESAKQLAGNLDARVVLLVPDVRSYSGPFKAAGDDGRAMAGRYRALADSVEVNATVLVCVCRRAIDVVRQMLGGSSVVIIGGRRRGWWPGRAERLVRQLTAEGYPAVFTPSPLPRYQVIPLFVETRS